MWFTVTNGAHTDSLDPAILDRWIEFLQIYVAQVVPKRPPLAGVVASVVGQQVWHTPVTLPPDRFANATSLLQAKATFEADPRLRVLFENGAAPGQHPDSRTTGSKATSARGRCPARARRRGTSTAAPRSLTADPAEGADSYTYDASRSQLTTLVGSGHDTVWLPLPAWQWTAPAPEAAVAYETPPLASDTVMVGNGQRGPLDQGQRARRRSAGDASPRCGRTAKRCWCRTAGCARVSARWRRVRRRCGRCTRTRRATSSRYARGEWNEARIELFPFGHAFRAGSKIRVIIDTPGGSRPSWKFDVLDDPAGTQIQIGRGANHASRVVLPVVPGVTVPPGLPACPSLRGQPCRPYAAL